MALPNLDGIDVDSFKKRKRNNSIEKRNGPKDMNINEHDEPFRKLNRISLSVFNRQDINVQIITPTSSGINEAARIIRRSSEIVSVPTEKSYSLFCSVPFQKPRMDATRNRNLSQGKKESWNTGKFFIKRRYVDAHGAFILIIMYRVNCRFTRNMSTHLFNINIVLNCTIVLESISTQADEASVYLFHPAQAYNFVSFSARKKFLYKSRSESNESSTSASNSDGSALLSAVSFSESHEVLNRLSSAFWPGFVTIYAPVRTRRLKASSICSNDDKNNLRGHGSTDSLTSFSSLSSEETGTDFSDLLASTPVVPDSILHSNEDLMLPVTRDERGQKCYVGMRCPSHPIARKILLQSYGQSEGKLTSRLKGAIIGIDSSKTCRDVCENLHSTKMANTRVHVVNGEDCREQFSVPPCQFGDLPSVSLVIDTPSRTVYLLRDTSQHEKDPKPATPSYFDVTMHQVSNALCQSIDCKNVKNRVMAAVMSKWKVAEIERPLKVGK